MNTAASASPDNPRWVVVDVSQGLSLALLREATDALAGSAARADDPASAALAAGAWARLLPTDPLARERDSMLDARMDAAAAGIRALGEVRWACPSLPWSPAEGAPPDLQLAGPVDLRRVSRGDIQVEPAAVALLAQAGAFGADLPARLRVMGTAAAGGSPPQLRLILLRHTSEAEQAAAAGTGPEDAILRELADAAPEVDQVVVIGFLVDDQSPEDLAIGLDRVRATPGVLDVSSCMVTGKKGRLAFRVEVLAHPAQAAKAARACLAETTTIGLRWHLTSRVTLRRELITATGPSGRSGAVKRVVRPGGQYGTKLEADVLAASGLDLLGRLELRTELESPKKR